MEKNNDSRVVPWVKAAVQLDNIVVDATSGRYSTYSDGGEFFVYRKLPILGNMSAPFQTWYIRISKVLSINVEHYIDTQGKELLLEDLTGKNSKLVDTIESYFRDFYEW